MTGSSDRILPCGRIQLEKITRAPPATVFLLAQNGKQNGKAGSQGSLVLSNHLFGYRKQDFEVVPAAIFYQLANMAFIGLAPPVVANPVVSIFINQM